jgi:hypothetical protein
LLGIGFDEVGRDFEAFGCEFSFFDGDACGASEIFGGLRFAGDGEGVGLGF